MLYLKNETTKPAYCVPGGTEYLIQLLNSHIAE